MIEELARGSGARARYRQIALASRVEGASPKQLVAILYDEAIQSIDLMIAALNRGDARGASGDYARAAAILHQLEDGIDHARGGPIGQSLTVIYRSALASLAVAQEHRRIAEAMAARDLLSDIAAAWNGGVN
jgi:flagellar secretion chaperone FliS